MIATRAHGTMKRVSMLAVIGASVGAAALFARPAHAAGLLIAEGPMGTSQLAIKQQDVRVTINNGIAVTQVTQVFSNAEERQVEALYTFPVPRGASVSNFSMWINGKEMTGEVVEKQRAREIYNSYKQVRRDPGLLEQTSYRTFEMRVFPIAPKSDQKVQITYNQQLEFDHDTATYVYPLATNTRGEANTAAGKFSLTLDAKSEIPITVLGSTSHAKDFAIATHGENYQQASMELSGASLNRDVVLTYTTKRPQTGIDIVANRAPGEDGYFYLTVTAGEELAALNTGMDYVFVMDISGSMAEQNKLESTRSSVGAFISGLAPEDRFEVITFNNAAAPLFSGLRAADAANKKAATDHLATLQPKGGTTLAPAVTTAYKYLSPVDAEHKARALNVVILSDGLTEQNETTSLFKLIKNRPAETRVFCIGVGNDVNRALLEQIANDSGGLAAFISRDDDFSRQASAFRRKLTRPAVTDLKIDMAGAEAYDLEPQALPNLYHGSPVRLYGRYKKSGNAVINVSGKVAGTEFSRKVNVKLPADQDANPQIERMWAWNRVDRLLKQGDAAGSREAVVPEIVRLGEGYSIVTEYTSFLVLENDAEFQRWQIQRKNTLRVSRDRAAQAALQQQLEEMRKTADATIGPSTPADMMKLPAAAAPQRTSSPPMASNTPAPNWDPPVRSTPAPSAPRDSGGGGGGGGGGFGGGGAFDPISATLVVGLGAAALISRRKQQKENTR